MFPSSRKIKFRSFISQLLLVVLCSLLLGSYVVTAVNSDYTRTEKNLFDFPRNGSPAKTLTSYPNVYEKIGQFDNNFGGTAINSFVRDGIAYVANDEEGLLILDVTDPTNPQFLSQCYDGEGYAWDIWVEGNYAYVADHLGGLEIINIADPLNPIKVGDFYDGSSALDVIVRDNVAYVADFLDGLEFIDVSNPSNPVKIGQFVGS